MHMMEIYKTIHIQMLVTSTGLRYFKFGDAVTNVTAGADYARIC